MQLPDACYLVVLHRIRIAAYVWRQMVFFLSVRQSDAIQGTALSSYLLLCKDFSTLLMSSDAGI